METALVVNFSPPSTIKPPTINFLSNLNGDAKVQSIKIEDIKVSAIGESMYSSVYFAGVG